MIILDYIKSAIYFTGKADRTKAMTQNLEASQLPLNLVGASIESDLQVAERAVAVGLMVGDGTVLTDFGN